MGTRNSTLVKINNRFVVAQYGQWDGYPEGQGQTILKTLWNCNLQELKEKCLGLTEITDAEMDELWDNAKKEAGDDSKGSFVNINTSRLFKEKYPHLHRDCGGEILQEVLNGAKKIRLDVDFAQNDSVFCEWAYIVDFDKNTFEVYKGTAMPANLFVSYSLDELPTIEEFLAECEEKQNAE